MFEGVAAAAAAGQPGGEDHPVVGQCGGRNAVNLDRVAEGVAHDQAGDPGVRRHRQGVAGVVVQPGQDLGVTAVGEPVVREVGLPGLIRQLGLEADVGRAGTLVRLGHHQAAASEVAADRGPRHRPPMMVSEVPGDRVRAGVQSLLGQFLAQPDDQLDGAGVDRVRRVCGRRDRGSNAASPSAR